VYFKVKLQLKYRSLFFKAFEVGTYGNNIYNSVPASQTGYRQTTEWVMLLRKIITVYSGYHMKPEPF
jgi:hypothetical protein